MGSKEEFLEYVLKRKEFEKEMKIRKEKRKQRVWDGYVIRRSEKNKR